jgi:hypothetical protein
VDVVIGKVVGVHVSSDLLTDGLVEVRKTQSIVNRCGCYQYTRNEEV